MIHRGWPERWEQWQERYDEFVESYNNVRPHEGLGMKRPAEYYRPSGRLYRAQVQAWRYAAGLEIKRVDANAMIRLEGQRLFVCEALRQREVAVEIIGRSALVRFRNMYIRELDLESGTSRGFVVPISQVGE